LIQVRGYPIGWLGICTTPIYADNFLQTSYEYYIHDINHVRRMYQFAIEQMNIPTYLNISERNKIIIENYDASDKFIKNILNPLIQINNYKEDQSWIPKLISIILLEIVHEDAFSANPNIIFKSLFRPPKTGMPRERRTKDNIVIYYMEPAGNLLSYIYQKLNGEFFDNYDKNDKQKEYLLPMQKRNRQTIIFAIKHLIDILRPIIFINLSSDHIDMFLNYLINDDNGYVNKFRNEFHITEQQIDESWIHDIETEIFHEHEFFNCLNENNFNSIDNLNLNFN